jgi:hypothetical protein
MVGRAVIHSRPPVHFKPDGEAVLEIPLQGQLDARESTVQRLQPFDPFSTVRRNGHEQA